MAKAPRGGAQAPSSNKGLAELKQRLFFLIGALIVYRIGSYIPVPGIDGSVLAALMEKQQGTLLAMFNVFSGGAMSRASIFALGIMPYISASIIIQILGYVEPKLQQLKKEGETGRKKINQITRYATVVLATIQAFSIAINFPGMAGPNSGLVINPGFGFTLTATVSLVTGTMFIMWLGEQINERGIGNGISMIIFAGIVSGMPGAIGTTFEQARQGEMSLLVVLAIGIIAVLVTAFVVYVERGQRRIVINYAKRQQGRQQFAAQSSHLPLKVNMSGVIPAIFASSIILFPGTIAQWFGQVEYLSWLRAVSVLLQPSEPLYILLYASLIIFFCFFYTALVFNPRDTADQLKKSGAFIPGIRPGEQTARHIDKILTRLTLVGALYMTAVCLLPTALNVWAHVSFYFGGTSLLIIVVVIMDFMSQVQSHLMSQQYDTLLKKANFKNIGAAGQIR
ncbi:MAG: preprotein translocase subunit SecY [Gammaproteobacteria bacterium CG22_combo_CG10-13_8_21_14_all_40_8]|nr:MAG: preprotein translocase subunit SecY [Gammaproteobacteria bacterium CG22_combo_CG10-13_8_21_14_all_40_8]